MSQGRLVTDFAGTREVARQFCDEHNLQLSQDPSPNGDPQISKKYLNAAEREAAIVDFGHLGFEKWMLTDVVYRVPTRANPRRREYRSVA